VSTPQTRYQDLCQALDGARERFKDYRSQCGFFAATFARGLVEYLGGPRDMVQPLKRLGEVGPAQDHFEVTDIEDALYLDEDTYWHLWLRLTLSPKGASDSIEFELKFKQLEKRYVVNLFGHEDFELPELSTDALRPVYDEVFASIKRHYEDGLRLFLDKRGEYLHLGFSAQRQMKIIGGG